jgi:dihydrofolate reductase
MGKLVVNMFVTLDGVMQAPGGPDEDREGGFEHGGWQAPLIDEDSGQAMGDHIAHMDALLLGRKTYEIFASYWPHATVDLEIAAKLNRMPKYVASRTLDRVEWNNSTLIEGDVAAAMPHLKEQHDEVHTFGSAGLIQTLLQHDLIDDLNLWVYPLLLGTGKRLFADGTIPTALRFVHCTTYSNGTMQVSYARAGKPTYGNMAQ